MNISPVISVSSFFKYIFSNYNSSENFFKSDDIKLGYARSAIVLAVKSLSSHYNIKAPVLWVPSLICDTVPLYISNFGIQIRYYQIDNFFNPISQSLNEICDDHFFLLVHYNGFVKDIDYLKKIIPSSCHVINDFAHSAPIDYILSDSISFGSASCFGLRKILPLYDGAFLRISNNVKLNLCNIDNSTLTRVSKRSIPGRAFWKMFLQHLIGLLRFNRKYKNFNSRHFITLSNNDIIYSFDPCSKINFLSNLLVTKSHLYVSQYKRQFNYRLYYSKLRNLDCLDIPFSPSENSNPWVFLFFHHNADAIIRKLNNIWNIPATYFPDVHISTSNFLSDTELTMYSNSIALPVHQDVSIKEIEFTCNILISILSDCHS